VNRLRDHLERQVASARRLLRIVLAQREAIQRQDVETVLVQLSEVQLEMATRAQLELERDEILEQVARRLGVSPETVDLDALLRSIPEPEASDIKERSAELRGLFQEIALVHGQNRVLIRQELSFLDHLIRVLSGTPQGGYEPFGEPKAAPHGWNAVDARA
jgi:flagellar biosynthesis/type III secretory pathway chaperone